MPSPRHPLALGICAALTLGACSSADESTKTTAGHSASETVKTVDDAGLKEMAKKLGCTSPQLMQSTKPKAKQLGVESATQCVVGKTGYILMRTKTPDQVGKAVSEIFGTDGETKGLPYVKGSNWAAFASGTGDKDKPTKELAESVASKIGGDVETIN